MQFVSRLSRHRRRHRQSARPHDSTLLAALDTTVASRDPTVQRLKRVEVAQRYKRKRKPFVYADRRAEEP